MIVKSFLTSVLMLALCQSAVSQSYNLPAVGLKSHQTMEVLGVDVTTDRTVIRLSVTNRIAGGTFCADKNIFLILPDRSRLKLTKSSGIPVCPDTYRFRKVGEELAFSLTFGQLPAGTGWFDLVEECGDNCFSVYGILLNDAFSRKIDEAIQAVDAGHVDTAIGLYQELIRKAGPGEAGIAGSLYCDLVSLLQSKGYNANAAEWYRKLAASQLPGKDLYIKNLNFRGIKF